MPRFPPGWSQSGIRWGDIAKSLKSSNLCFFLLFLVQNRKLLKSVPAHGRLREEVEDDQPRNVASDRGLQQAAPEECKSRRQLQDGRTQVPKI